LTRSRRPGRAYWPEAFKSHFTIRSLDARRVEEWARPRSAASIDVPAVVRLGCSLPRRSGRVPKSHGSVQRSMDSCKSEESCTATRGEGSIDVIWRVAQSLPTYLVPSEECRTRSKLRSHNSSKTQGEIHTLRQKHWLVPVRSDALGFILNERALAAFASCAESVVASKARPTTRH